MKMIPLSGLANNGFLSVSGGNNMIFCQRTADPDRQDAGIEKTGIPGDGPINETFPAFVPAKLAGTDILERWLTGFLRKLEAFGEKLTYVHRDADKSVVIMPDSFYGARGLILKNKKSDISTRTDNLQL